MSSSTYGAYRYVPVSNNTGASVDVTSANKHFEKKNNVQVENESIIPSTHEHYFVSLLNESRNSGQRVAWLGLACLFFVLIF
jgi:hypothetical protein